MTKIYNYNIVLGIVLDKCIVNSCCHLRIKVEDNNVETTIQL